VLLDLNFLPGSARRGFDFLGKLCWGSGQVFFGSGILIRLDDARCQQKIQGRIRGCFFISLLVICNSCSRKSSGKMQLH